MLRANGCGWRWVQVVHGRDLVWIELLKQPHFSEHPSL